MMMQAMWRRVAIGAVVLVVGCGALDVSDPTKVEDGELANAAGAALLRGDALRQFYVAVGLSALETGILSDELYSDNPPDYVSLGLEWEEVAYDRRDSEGLETRNRTTLYSEWKTARRAATLAMPKLLSHGTAAQVGEMYALRAFAVLSLAEQACSGFPLHDLHGLTPVYSGPLTADQAFARAIADFDSALALATDSARILDFARIGKARALVGLGRFADVAALTTPVSAAYVHEAVFSTSANRNPFEPIYSNRYLVRGVADREGGTGLDFVSADDPRLAVDSVGMTSDGTTTMYGAAKYPDPDAPIVVASGIEARLLEAEAALNGGGDWLGILNALRAANAQALAPLADPGSDAARVDLLFRERAFWLYGTGHRLGDLRRLIARYGRATEAVFPTGAYRLGGTYGSGTSIPFNPSRDAGFSPTVTACTSR